MANTMRITKAVRFTQLLAVPEVLEIEGMEGFLQHELEMVQRKSASTSLSASAKQTLAMSDVVRGGIADGTFAVGECYTIPQFCEFIESAVEGRCSPQRANPMLKALAEEGLLEYVKQGKVVTYKVVAHD